MIELFKYTLSTLGGSDQHIRICWQADGRRRNAYGSLSPASFGSPGSIAWLLGDEVPAALAIAAAQCAEEIDIPATVYVGQESPAEMERWVESCCSACGERQASMQWLSNEGLCGKCFCSHAPSWLDTLRSAGAL